MFRSAFLWLGLSLLLCTGCSSVPLFSMSRFKEADARHPVGEILCVWEAAEGRGLDNLPCRGFGGQILLFANGIKEPVKASGDVRIYVFDDQGVDGDSSKPVHQFDFPAAAWNAFLKPSNLGASYQIFIPYTRKGMHAATCSLRVRFTPEGGLPVYSRMATVELAGHATAAHPSRKQSPIVTVSGKAESTAGSGIQTADFETLQSAPAGITNAAVPATPGISLGSLHAARRDADTLDSLRRAALEASHTSPETDHDSARTADSLE